MQDSGLIAGAANVAGWIRGIEHRRRIRVRVRRAFLSRQPRRERGPLWYRLLVWAQRNCDATDLRVPRRS